MKSIFLRKVNLFFSPLLIFLLHIPFVFAKSKPIVTTIAPQVVPGSVIDTACTHPVIGNIFKTNVYDSLRLASFGLARQVFDYAVSGFNVMKEMGTVGNSNIISIIDFSKPSSLKRLFVIDIKNYKLLFNTYVAHGMNSGKEFANQFSNMPESNKSSLGFYTTAGTYLGKHGYSLHLLGMEKGINDNAYSRDIVMHGARYVSENTINEQGYLGRSLGCPAIPERLHKPIIDKIKDGTCLFIFGADKKYLSHSKILNNNFSPSFVAGS